MVIHASYPVYYTPDSTNSGIVNVYGPIVHGPTTSGFVGPQLPAGGVGAYFPDATINPIVYLEPLMGGYTTGPTIIPELSKDFIPSIQYISESIQSTNNEAVQPLGFTYFVYVEQNVYTIAINLSAFVNVISIEDIVGYITPTQQSLDDLSSFIRSSTNSNESFEAGIGVVVPQLLFQIFTKGEFIYAAVQKGIEIFDVHTGNSLYLKDVPYTRIKTLWGNDTTLYFGGIGGIFSIDYADLHADLENSVISNSFSLKSNVVNYIHGSGNSLLVSTTSGVEYFNWSGNPVIKSRAYIENVSKCFLVDDSAYYITNTTISGETTWTLNKKYNLITDWTLPTATYSNGDTFTLSTALTDIFVTKGTAAAGGNTIFCATTSGIYVIDEDTNNKAIYYTR